MNTSEYIASGILELYVMGSLSEEEARGVEHMMAAHPEIRREVEEIRSSLETYALKSQVPPPPGLKDRIINAATGPVNQGSGKVMPVYYRFSVAASVLLLIGLAGSLYMNYRYYQSRETWEQLANDRAQEILDMQDKMLAERMENVKNSQELEVLKHPGMISIELKPMDTAMDAKAMVYKSMKSHEVFLEVVKLPPPPEGMQYQLWGMVKGKPVDAGLIDTVITHGMHQMVTIENATAFAISLETKGGNPSPKGKIYVMGSV